MSTATDEACPLPTPPPTPETPSEQGPLNIDLPCEDKVETLSARSRTSDKSETAQYSARSKISGRADPGSGDVAAQTRRESGCNPENPPSLSKSSPPSVKKEPLDVCVEKPSKAPPSRNPITGLGLGGDGVGGIKQKKPRGRRDGNPVTGEGYKSGNECNPSVPSMNGANQVINKNRIPPGGFSSGLW